MSRVIHFEIHAEDPERCATFYRDVFGWRIEPWPGMEYWVVYSGPKDQPGIDGGILRRKGAAPVDGQAVNAYVCTMEVTSIDACIKKIEDAGGTVAMEKFDLGGMAWQAYYKDTEGNIFGLHEPIKKN